MLLQALYLVSLFGWIDNKNWHEKEQKHQVITRSSQYLPEYSRWTWLHPNTHKLTSVVFLDPTLALWTRSFLSPSCMPLSPAIACITEKWRDYNAWHFVLSIPQATLHPRKCTLFLEDNNGTVNHLVMLPWSLPPSLRYILQMYDTFCFSNFSFNSPSSSSVQVLKTLVVLKTCLYFHF